MDASRAKGIFFAGVNNEARREALPIVEATSDGEELLREAVRLFDERVTSIDAQQVLTHFDVARLCGDLWMTDGFDPTLFRATLLFELAYASSEDIISEVIDRLLSFWHTGMNADQDMLAETFTSETRRAKPEPFTAMSQFIVHKMVDVGYAFIRGIKDKAPDVDRDPIERDLDRPRYTVWMGDFNYTPDDEHPVLTRQLVRDLHQLYLWVVIEELEDRFPDDGIFADIAPMIDRIMNDRREANTPPDDVLLKMYDRSEGRYAGLLGYCDDRDLPEDERLRRAAEYYRDRYRTLPPVNSWDYYVPSLGEWYTVAHMVCPEHSGVRYRRIFIGDRTSLSLRELPLDKRSGVIEYLDRVEKRSCAQSGEGAQPRGTRDIVGGFMQVFPSNYTKFNVGVGMSTMYYYD